MKPASHYQTIIELLDQFFVEDIPPLDRYLHHFFKHNRYIGSKDRRKITSVIYKIIRHYYQFVWWIERDKQIVRGRTLVLFYGYAYGDLQEFGHYFSNDKYGPEALNLDEKAWVKSLVERGKPKTLDHVDMKDATRLECHKENLTYFDEKTLAALNEQAPFDLRVNTLLAKRETMLKQLIKDGFEPKITPYSPFGIRLSRRIAIEQYDWFKKGQIEVQDEGSQIAGLLVDAKPGEMILDLCAGAGGKSLLLAQLMENRGKLTLSDIDKKRLGRAKIRLKRAGVSNHQIKAVDETKYFKRHHGYFNKVLVDAPCTGVGVWRRNPEARLRPIASYLERLLPTQAELLDKGAKYVKLGGTLIYVTCSLLQQENEVQIEAFLERNKGFKLKLINFLDFKPYNEEVPAQSYLKLDPGTHGTDGFFGAVLERES